MTTPLDWSLVDRIARLSSEKRMVLEKRMTAAVVRDSSPTPGSDRPTAPTSFAQRSQWFVNRLDPDNPFFNKTDAVRIRGPLDVEALQRALTSLVDRHAVLRTGYGATDDGPLQVVRPSSVEMTTIDLPQGPGQGSELQRHLAATQRQPFDLENGPMYRAELIRLGEDDHVLVRTNHHIAFDRWSTAIANAELSELYRAFSTGEEPQLSPLPYQYADFAVWQRTHFDQAKIDRHLEFAAAHLAGVPQVLELPVDHPRPVSQRHQGASYSTSLDEGLVAKIRQRARDEGATPFMLCLATFGVLVGRYARTDQFLIGVPAAGRNTDGTEALIGLFINSMVLRLDLRGNPTFSELVARVRTSVLGVMSHQDLPFDVLVEKLGQRVPGRTPMFQVMLDYINTPSAGLTLGSLEMEQLSIPDMASVYDINLYLYDDGRHLDSRWEYRSDLFDRSTIVRMSGAYATMLEAAVDEPSRPIGAIPLVSIADRPRVRALGAGPSIDTPSEGTYLETIARLARERPDSTAVVAGDTSLTYRMLWNQVEDLSQRLEAATRSDASITIETGRTKHLIPALLGVLYAGRTAVMIDTAQPEARLASMLDQIDIAARITTGARDPEIEVVGIRSDHGVQKPEPPAYVVFTSGSTGTPSPVAVGRAALDNFVADACDRYQIGSEDRVLQFASPGFDTLLEEVLPALASGATLVMRPQELFSSFYDFTRFVADQNVTVLDLPTAWWHVWVDDMTRTGKSMVPDTVRLVIIGGEAARTDQWRAWQRMTAGRVRLVNTYGPSETTVVVAVFEPPPTWSPSTRFLPIGLPIRNTSLLIVDQAGELVPPGVPGELVVEGIPVGDGYLSDDGRSDRFVGNADGEPRRFHTGDLVRVSVDGVHEYLGRIDDQVKVSGVRIEPGEIETALRSHEAVDDAVVLGVDGPDGISLVAHVQSSGEVAEDAIRSHLMDMLPPTMIPGSIFIHTSLPMTVTGKVDRLILRDHAPDQVEVFDDMTADRSPTQTEQRMREVWRTTLPQSSPRLDDDFFAIGGHSLLGVRLVSHASDVFGVELPLRVIYEAPTIAGMARWVDELLDEAPRHVESREVADVNT